MFEPKLTQFELGHIKRALMDAGTEQASYALKLIKLAEEKAKPSKDMQTYLDHMQDATKLYGAE